MNPDLQRLHPYPFERLAALLAGVPAPAALSPVLVGSDVNLSQLIRSCIHTALPLLVARPALISILPTLPVAVDRESTR